ncbi:MAG: NTP transferase domain-containing protein [Candidatus Didemnitutus sp.]|nr:NTP transferase domain-containing protein [Candidatus Didemnitutus sp.]
MQTAQHVVIAAAGLGSRLGHGKPKCLVEVAGRSILEWQLDLMRDVPDVRVVVGYLEHEVIEAAFKIRGDVTIVRNPAYRTTTTQQSYWLGARYLTEPCVYLDGDIIFDRESFQSFLRSAVTQTPLIGVTQAKTEHAVFAATEAIGDEATLNVTGFSRTERSLWEWANVACLPPGLLEENGRDVFSRLALHTPLRAQAVVCCEVDTESDLSQAREFVACLQQPREPARSVA